jgi:hypothetical protein
MGGLNSGRRRTRNRGAVHATCRVDLRYLRRVGALREGHWTAGEMRWSRSGEPCGSMAYSVVLTGPKRRLDLTFTFNGSPRAVSIDLEAVPMRFGGWRYYALCPVTGRRCVVLPVVGGVVASRQAHRLTYATQSMDPLDRARERRDRLEATLNGKRRRGRNRKRLTEAWVDAAVEFERMMDTEAMRRFGALF